MLVDMDLPRAIPEKVALRMVRSSIKTIMYIRGQMGSTWEQLAQMLQVENLGFVDETQGPDDGTTPFPGSSTPVEGPSRPRSTRQTTRKNNGTSPTKSLQEFLETGERMFVDLEESIHSQLHSRYKSPSSGSSPPPLYISLALLIGTTITMPQEQFMIRIGPLEPLVAAESLTPSIRVPFARLDIGIADHHENGLDRNPADHKPFIQSNDPQKLKIEEKAWERRLAQQIMGINSIDMEDTENDRSPALDSLSKTLPSRAKVHLLMKAPPGLVFQGMLPKQTIVIQEDFSMESKSEGAPGTATATVGMRGRWPVYHVQILGPMPNKPPICSEYDSDKRDDASLDLWYQVGSGIPALSTLL
ncbi:hypothetical protein BGX31_010711 [Mortierella sp. GBA43]|nr:hypothetical protein BGX31_010711 [Mortierella sp. GBA43]